MNEGLIAHARAAHAAFGTGGTSMTILLAPGEDLRAGFVEGSLGPGATLRTAADLPEALRMLEPQQATVVVVDGGGREDACGRLQLDESGAHPLLLAVADTPRELDLLLKAGRRRVRALGGASCGSRNGRRRSFAN